MAVENLANASYTEFTTEISHQRVEGIYASPVAGPGPQNASLVRLHAPFETITVYWTATREGAPPIIPSPNSYTNNLNRIFLGGARTGLVVPTFGGHSYSVSGVWVFQIVGPESLDGDLFLARTPWENSEQGRFMIPAQNFQKGILDATYIQPIGLPVDPDVILLNPITG